jgi:hypothetical protein
MLRAAAMSTKASYLNVGVYGLALGAVVTTRVHSWLKNSGRQEPRMNTNKHELELRAMLRKSLKTIRENSCPFVVKKLRKTGTTNKHQYTRIRIESHASKISQNHS